MKRDDNSELVARLRARWSSGDALVVVSELPPNVALPLQRKLMR
jgi:hypothetical protein